MGRGRAKAKQVKVARQLKYNGGGTDLNRLRQELGVGTEARSADHDDPYADEYNADDEDSLDDDDSGEDDDEDDGDSLDDDDSDDEDSYPSMSRTARN